MNCEKCGQEIPKGLTDCPHCKQQATQPTPENNKKQKFNKKIILTAVITVLCCCCIFFALAAFGVIDIRFGSEQGVPDSANQAADKSSEAKDDATHSGAASKEAAMDYFVEIVYNARDKEAFKKLLPPLKYWKNRAAYEKYLSDFYDLGIEAQKEVGTGRKVYSARKERYIKREEESCRILEEDLGLKEGCISQMYWTEPYFDYEGGIKPGDVTDGGDTSVFEIDGKWYATG